MPAVIDYLLRLPVQGVLAEIKRPKDHYLGKEEQTENKSEVSQRRKQEAGQCSPLVELLSKRLQEQLENITSLAAHHLVSRLIPDSSVSAGTLLSTCMHSVQYGNPTLTTPKPLPHFFRDLFSRKFCSWARYIYGCHRWLERCFDVMKVFILHGCDIYLSICTPSRCFCWHVLYCDTDVIITCNQ